MPCFKGKGIMLPQLCMHIRPSKFELFFVVPPVRICASTVQVQLLT